MPLIWLAYISGIGGYWITWDRLAQFSAAVGPTLMHVVTLGAYAATLSDDESAPRLSVGQRQ